VYFEDEILPLEIAQNRCQALIGVLVDKSNMFLTKLKFQIKDCQNNLLFETAEVKSKEKDIQMGYIDAIKLLSPELKKYQPVLIEKKEVVATKPIELEKQVVEESSDVTKTVFSGCKLEAFSNGFNVVPSNPLQTLFIQKLAILLSILHINIMLQEFLQKQKVKGYLNSILKENLWLKNICFKLETFTFSKVILF